MDAYFIDILSGAKITVVFLVNVVAVWDIIQLTDSHINTRILNKVHSSSFA